MHDVPRPPRRITPGIISFYAREAHRLREEAYRGMVLGLWARLARIVRRALSRRHVC
jgi:hypothetical protein